MSDLQIVECTRCKAPQVFKDAMKDSEIPVALEVDLNGGYGMFIDNWQDDDKYRWLLCHKCAHEFVAWAGMDLSHGHQNTDESFCNGWTKEWFDEQVRIENQFVQDELAKRRAAKNG